MRRFLPIGVRVYLPFAIVCVSTVLSGQGGRGSEGGYVISGHIADPGQRVPGSALLLLRGPGEAANGSTGSIPVPIRTDRTFSTPRVPQGTYVLDVISEFAPGVPVNVIGSKILRLGDADASGVVVEVGPPTAIKGRVRMAATDTAAKPPEWVVVNAPLALDGMGMWDGKLADRGPDGTFVLSNVPGPRILRVGYKLAEGQPWWPLRVTLDGADITNVPTDFSQHQDGSLEIVFSRNPPRITGSVTDSRGLAARAPWVFVNSTNPRLRQRWSTTSQAAAANGRGRFSLVVPPGSYLVHAVANDAFDSLREASQSVLHFASEGATVALAENEVKVVHLKLSVP